MCQSRFRPRDADAISREILARPDEVGVGIASATFAITALPELRLGRSGQSLRGKEAATDDDHAPRPH